MLLVVLVYKEQSNMYSINGFGQNRPMCNNRQFGTMGIVKNQPEEMNLKPEYLGNEHFKFLNNFGLQRLISDKKFVDINNCVNRQHSSNRMALNPSHMRSIPSTFIPSCVTTQSTNPNYSIYKGVIEKPNPSSPCEEYSGSVQTSKSEDTNKSDMVMSKHDTCNKTITKNCEDFQGCCSMKLPKKTKRNSKTQCDKNSQKSSPKKSKTQKNYQKQSKRESDRSIVGNSRSPRKRRNCKLWHKKSLEMEIMEVDDSYSNYNENLESPSFCTRSLPNVESICIQNKINTLSSPIKVINEMREQNNQHSPPIFDFREELPSDIHMSQSPKQNNFRPRLPSECESEDSFIVFEDSSKCFDFDTNEESSDLTSSSDEDSDDSDVMDFCSTTPSEGSCRIQVLSPCKKVRFAVGKNLCEMHPMVQWSFAYQKARKGPWEQFAVDRMRFRNRVSDIEPVLNVILQPAHRSKIYQDRFLENDNCIGQ